MVRILHTADIHFQNGKLLEDIVRSTNFIVSTAREEKPDLTIIAGDLFDEKVDLDSPATKEAVNFVTDLAKYTPVLILQGTKNHDQGSLHIFRNIKTLNQVFVCETIDQVLFTDRGFEILDPANFNTQDKVIAVVSCLPPLTKAHILASRKADLQESNFQVLDLLRDLFQVWGDYNRDFRNIGIPTVLAAHGTLLGAENSTGQKMVGKDIEFGAGDLRIADADAYLLGHIHKAQSYGNIFYSGDVAPLDYGEEEDKGFWIHEFNPALVSSRFIKTPIRKVTTIDITSKADLEKYLMEDLKNARVRIRCEVKEEEQHVINDLELETLLKEKGASEVKIVKTVIPKYSVRAAGISTLSTHEDKFKKWGETVNTPITESLLEKLKRIQLSSLDDVKKKPSAFCANDFDSEPENLEQETPVLDSPEEFDLFSA